MKTLLKKVNGIGILGILLASTVVYAKANQASAVKNLRSNTYYVIGETATTYLLSDDPQHAANCIEAAPRPCEVVTSEANPTLPEEVAKNVIDDEMNLTITGWRNSF